MRHVPVILLVLALPAGAVGYLVSGGILAGLGLQQVAGGLLVMFLPLLVGGLCMVPFVIPFFDRMAKRDLAAHRAAQETEAADAARKAVRRGQGSGR
jgi:type III secretory pathway component EscR